MNWIICQDGSLERKFLLAQAFALCAQSCVHHPFWQVCLPYVVAITESWKFSNSRIQPQAVTDTEAEQWCFENLHIWKVWNYWFTKFGWVLMGKKPNFGVLGGTCLWKYWPCLSLGDINGKREFENLMERVLYNGYGTGNVLFWRFMWALSRDINHVWYKPYVSIQTQLFSNAFPFFFPSNPAVMNISAIKGLWN